MVLQTTFNASAGTSRQAGYMMIEVMVTLIILLIGLLGLAGLSLRANQTEMESYQRAQALLLVQDMVERINANRKVATCYSNGGGTGVQLGAGSASIPPCGSGNALQQAQAVADLTAWDAMLKGQAEQRLTANVGAMIGAVGCVALDDAANNIYMVAVSWQGLAPTAAPKVAAGTAFPCGNGLYGDEKLHRVVSSKVRIGTLL
jgi:type IV pilus assembly protein PilV